jgi:hypothetical protein
VIEIDIKHKAGIVELGLKISVSFLTIAEEIVHKQLAARVFKYAYVNFRASISILQYHGILLKLPTLSIYSSGRINLLVFFDIGICELLSYGPYSPRV